MVKKLSSSMILHRRLEEKKKKRKWIDRNFDLNINLYNYTEPYKRCEEVKEKDVLFQKSILKFRGCFRY